MRLAAAHPRAGTLTGKRRLRRPTSHPYPYLIFHRAEDDEIVVHGVRHAARRPASMPEQSRRSAGRCCDGALDCTPRLRQHSSPSPQWFDERRGKRGERRKAQTTAHFLDSIVIQKVIDCTVTVIRNPRRTSRPRRAARLGAYCLQRRSRLARRTACNGLQAPTKSACPVSQCRLA